MPLGEGDYDIPTMALVQARSRAKVAGWTNMLNVWLDEHGLGVVWLGGDGWYRGLRERHDDEASALNAALS